MAEVDTSIYKTQPNPLGTAQGVFGLLNTAAQNQLLQTATQQRALELQQSQANDLLTTVAPLANKPGLTQAEVLGTLADRARQLGINGKPLYDIAAKRYQGPDWQNNLKLDAIRSLGPTGLTNRMDVVEPGTGAKTSIPAAATIGTQYPSQMGVEEAAAAGAAGGLGGTALGNARTMSQNLASSTYGLKQAISAVRALGPQGTGPFTKELTGIKSFLITSGAAKQLGIEDDTIKNVSDYQVANKYLNDWARQSGDTHSVAHLDAAQESNPNMSLQQNSIIKTARTSLGLARMRSAQQQAFDQTGLPASKFTQWVSQNWKKDPVVYMFDAMTPPERNKYVKSLGDKNKQDAFLADVGRAEKGGMLELEPF